MAGNIANYSTTKVMYTLHVQGKYTNSIVTIYNSQRCIYSTAYLCVGSHAV